MCMLVYVCVGGRERLGSEQGPSHQWLGKSWTPHAVTVKGLGLINTHTLTHTTGCFAGSCNQSVAVSACDGRLILSPSYFFFRLSVYPLFFSLTGWLALCLCLSINFCFSPTALFFFFPNFCLSLPSPSLSTHSLLFITSHSLRFPCHFPCLTLLFYVLCCLFTRMETASFCTTKLNVSFKCSLASAFTLEPLELGHWLLVSDVGIIWIIFCPLSIKALLWVGKHTQKQGGRCKQ